MEIVTRFKNADGLTVGYTIRHNGKDTYVSAKKAISMSEFIDNAIITKNREFRAKPGYSIDTVLSKNNLKAVSKLCNTNRHNYIDVNKLKVYNKDNISVWGLVDKLKNEYKITNVIDDKYDEHWCIIAKALCDDITEERANYEAYIEVGMDARLLMELRKSAILPMSKELYDFYTGHKNLDTAKQVKEYRTNYLKFLNDDYTDDDWQYYILVLTHLRAKSNTLDFNFEFCFEDGKDEDYIPTHIAREMFLHHIGYDMKHYGAD